MQSGTQSKSNLLACFSTKMATSIQNLKRLLIFSRTSSHPLDKNMASAEFSIPPVQHPFSDSNISFSETDIIEVIDEIKPNASPGPDEIPTVLLSNCKHAVAKPIYLIWSMSLKSGKVPSCYKLSIVTTLYKKYSSAIPSNYRPVSPHLSCHQDL